MRRRHHGLDRAAALAVRGLARVVAGLPFDLAIGLARAAGRAIGAIDRRHRRVADANLRLAYGDALAPRDRRRIIARVYGNLASLGVEIVHFHRRVTPENLQRYIALEGWDLRDRPELERGAIYVTGHVGNWELLGTTVALLGIPLHAVERPLDNPHLARYVRALRERYGMRMIAKDGAMRRVASVLRSGGSLGLLLDQHARKQAVRVPFFGRPAWTSDVAGRLAVRYGLPVIVGVLHHVGPGPRFRMRVDPPIRPRHVTGARAEALRITIEVTRRLEARIREDPGRWLWLHRRWRDVPRHSRTRHGGWGDGVVRAGEGAGPGGPRADPR